MGIFKQQPYQRPGVLIVLSECILKKKIAKAIDIVKEEIVITKEQPFFIMVNAILFVEFETLETEKHSESKALLLRDFLHLVPRKGKNNID